MSSNSNYLKEIFLKSVQINSAANINSKTLPSSEGQSVLACLLVDELNKLGIKDVQHAQNGYLIARLPANTKAPAIAFLSHLDTVALIGAEIVTPLIHENYNGKDIILPKDGTVIEISDFPELKEKNGKTIISSDGSTILGADDKSGVAIQMELARLLSLNSEIKHGEVVLVFTPDEEIGHQCQSLDIEMLKVRCAYTLDGSGVGAITNECFCADLLTVIFKGKDIHTCCAKDKMINSMRIASDFINELPAKQRPENTEKREGFIHLYKIYGTVSDTTVSCLLRDFEETKLKELGELAKKIAQKVLKKYPDADMDFTITKQYRNMKYYIDQDLKVVEFAQKAFVACGIKPVMQALRGGTDGANLSSRGLPCPNLSVGYEGEHGKAEWACLEDMQNAVQVALKLIQIWSENA